MYKALYRKYRPDSFATIFGQKHVVQTLQNAITQHKIGHAYLFHGPRGTGKTSIAKIFAAAVNCLHPDAQTLPCHNCENCQLIDSGQATDIIELDAASNNGVDEIRMIREYARYAPTNLPYKVYIIDEVHMLSTAAFNALLKTLEEPPAHVIFILATTEIHKIPQTIISRTQRFDFTNISINDMKACLQPILQQEQVTMDEDALNYLTQYADGGMRDVLSILDQAITYSQGHITKQTITDITGTVDETVYYAILQDVIESNTAHILEVLDQLITSGKNVQLFVEEFLKFLLHEVQLQMQGKSQHDGTFLFFMIEKMNQLAYEMKTAFLPQVALQALFLEITYDGQQVAPQQREQKVTEVSKQADIVPETPATESEALFADRLQNMQENMQAETTELNDVAADEKIIAEQPIINPEVEELEVATSEPVNNEQVETNISTSTTEHNNQLAEQEFLAEEEANVSSMDEPEVDVLDLFNADMVPESEDEIDVVFDFKKQEVDSVVTEEPDVTAVEEVGNAEAESSSPVPEMAEPLPEQIVDADINVAAAPESETISEVSKKDILSSDLLLRKKRLTIQRMMAEVVMYPEYNQLEKIKRKWQLIPFNPTEPLIAMLQDLEPKIATKTELILSGFNRSLANQMQLPKNIVFAERYVSELMGQEYHLVIVDEAFWLTMRAEFVDHLKTNQITDTTIDNLAKEALSLEEEALAQGYEYVTLDFGSDEAIDDEPEVVKEAKELFDDLVVIE